ncbi:MAG TPA: hypothetical protein VGI16_12820 [Candidatus Acidoferrum sp.]|jgi:hypothetical protein
MRGQISFLLAALVGLAVSPLSFAQNPPVVPAVPVTTPETRTLLQRVIVNVKRDEAALLVYERLQRQESRRNATAPPDVKFTRVIPAGTGNDQIPVGPDGVPADPAAYRAALEKLEHSLAWAAQDGRAQQDAYDKLAKKQKDRYEMVEATHGAFVFTFVAREPRGDRMLTKYRMQPNPAYKPTSRSTALFSKVRGYVWIDEDAAELARVEAEITDDISFGAFVAKLYKGSFFMQERYPVGAGLWLPSYSQYDYEGRKFFSTFVVHERSFFSHYRRIGAPKEALATIRAELNAEPSANADP